MSDDGENKNMKVYWADKEKNVSRGGRRQRGRVDKSQEEEGGSVCGRDSKIMSTVIEFGRYWCTCGRPQTSFLEIKTTHILRSLRGTRR